MDPRVHEATAFNKRKKMTAQEIWEYDANKYRIAIDAGFNITTIWELDFISAPDKHAFMREVLNEYE